MSSLRDKLNEYRELCIRYGEMSVSLQDLTRRLQTLEAEIDHPPRPMIEDSDFHEVDEEESEPPPPPKRRRRNTKSPHPALDETLDMMTKAFISENEFTAQELAEWTGITMNAAYLRLRRAYLATKGRLDGLRFKLAHDPRRVIVAAKK